MPVPEASLALWAKVKANHARLDACKGPHQFVEITPRVAGPRYRCTTCEGEVDFHAQLWYHKGYEHAKAQK